VTATLANGALAAKAATTTIPIVFVPATLLSTADEVIE
jgi:hypothetical protein